MVSAHGNTLESIPLESRPHRTLEMDLVCIEGDRSKNLKTKPDPVYLKIRFMIQVIL